MSEFRIKCDNVESCANELVRCRGRVNRIASELRDSRKQISEMKGLSMLREMADLSKRMEILSKSLADNGESLRRITMRYEEADRKVYSDMISNSVGKDESDSASSEAASSGGGNYRDETVDSDKYLSTKLSDIDDDEKDKLIRNFEQNYPNEADIMNDFLNSEYANSLSEDDIRNLKYIFYDNYLNNKRYGKIYFDRVLSNSTLVIRNYSVDDDCNKVPNYDSDKKYVYLDLPEDFQKEYGIYSDIFHELGHGIDAQSNITDSDDSNLDTSSFSVPISEIKNFNPDYVKGVEGFDGDTLTIEQANIYDVYYNLDNPNSIASIAKDLGYNIEASELSEWYQKTTNHGWFSSLFFSEQYNVMREFNKRIGIAVDTNSKEFTPPSENGFKTYRYMEYYAITDIYGGVTDNSILYIKSGDTEPYTASHSVDYWSNHSTSSEAFAEYMQFQMTANYDEIAAANLKNYNTYLPLTAELMEAYIDELNPESRNDSDYSSTSTLYSGGAYIC